MSISFKLVKDRGVIEIVPASEGDKFTFPNLEAAEIAKEIAYSAMGELDFKCYDHRPNARDTDHVSRERAEDNKSITRSLKRGK